MIQVGDNRVDLIRRKIGILVVKISLRLNLLNDKSEYAQVSGFSFFLPARSEEVAL